MSAEADPALAHLAPEQWQQLARGIAEFNERRFYECHDTLEELWSGLRGEPRSFVQGLIQVAVGFYHLGNGNQRGALRLLGRGLERLAAYPAGYCGLQLGPFREAVRRWHHAVEAGQLPEEPPPPIERTVREPPAMS